MNVVSLRDLRTQGSVALADSPSFRAAKAEGTLGPNAGNLPHNVQSTSAATNYGAWPAPPPGTGHPYPDMPAVSDARPLLDQMGATGVAIFSGIITSEEYNPDFYWRDGVKIFDQMLRSDGQINAMRMQVEMPLQRATWSIEPASKDAIDQEIASFVETCLFDEMHYETSEGRHLTQKWGDTLRHILLSLWYGFSAMEVCWRVEDGWVKWARWLPLLPRTVWRWWVGEDNELVGIQQWTFKNYSYQFVEIPADKLLLFVHRMEGNNYEGVSLLRTAYKHWWYKSNFEKIEAIGIERNAVVPAVVYLPENFTSNDLSYAQTVVQNIRANELGGITLPARSTGWDLEYPKNQQRYAMQAQPSIQYHDVMIARNVLAQFLNLGSTETGAYALADSQLDSFRAALQGVADYIEDVVNNDAIRRLVDYNYDGVVNYPKLKCSKIALQDLNRLSTLLQALQAYLPPSPELSDFIAQEIGLPVVPSSVVQTTNPGSPNTPDRPQNQNANNHETEESDTKDGTDVAETPPSEGSGSAGGGQAGGDAAVSSGGSARSGLGEPGSEAWLLREAVSAAYAHDAVQRGVDYALRQIEVIHHVVETVPAEPMVSITLSGHPPGYTQNRDAGGRWAPGDGGAGHQEAGDRAGGRVSVKREAAAGGKAGGGRASYHIRHTDVQGNVIHEEHKATLARVNEYASKQGIAGKLTGAHFQTDAEHAAAKAAKDAAKAKRDAMEEQKAAAELRVKTAEANARKTESAFKAADKAAQAKRIANADEITRVSQERHEAFIASHNSYTAAREAIAEERAIAKGEAAKSKTVVENYAKMQAAKQPWEDAKTAYEAAKVIKDASEAHAQALQNRYYDEWRQAHPNASPYGALAAISRAHPDYKAADTQRWKDHRAFDKAQSAMWRAESKYRSPRDRLAGKITDAEIQAHPLHAGVKARLVEADAKLGDLTGDTAKRAAFDAREAAKQELKDAQNAYKHPTWKYTLHSEPTHHALYTNLDQWPAGTLDAARAADKGTLDRHEGDRALAELAHAQGFDGKPDVVTEAELEQFSQKGEVELWRGDTKESHTDNLMMGEYHAGLGVHGSGTYTALASHGGRETARSYASGTATGRTNEGLVVRMTVKKDARVIDYDHLKELARETVRRAERDEQAARASGDRKALDRALTLKWLAEGKSERGASRFAVALGYDAININTSRTLLGQWVILNRSAVRFSHQVRGSERP